MPVMSRGPELELSTIKDVEDLKHTLAQAAIHVPNDVLRRAIILPKDVDTTAGVYMTPLNYLPKNPLNDFEYMRYQDKQNALMKDLNKWRHEVFPYTKPAKTDEELAEKAEKKKNKNKK